MKLLFDQNISFRTVHLLQEYFPLAKHVKDFELQFATDIQIWNFAKANNYHIVTFDADFYDLVTLYGHPPKIIWVRLGNTSTINLSKSILHHKEIIFSFINDIEDFEIGCLEIK